MTSSMKYNDYSSAWNITFCFMLIAVCVMFPDVAAAGGSTSGTTITADANNNQLTLVICNVIEMLQGNIARGVAAFGIIFLGFSLFLGKIAWGTAFALAIGLGAIFGAQALVNLMSSGTGALDCTVMTSANNT